MKQLQFVGLASLGVNLFLFLNLCIRMGFDPMRMLFILIYLFLISVFVTGFGYAIRNGQPPIDWPLAIIATAGIGGMLAWI